MKRADEGKGGSAKVGRAVGDKRTHPMFDLHHAQSSQVTNPCTQRGPADIELAGKVALGWNLVARLKLTSLNHPAHVVDHLHGSVAFSAFRFGMLHGRLFASCDGLKTN